MVCNVIVKSADISKADAPQSSIKLLTTEEAEKVTVGEYVAASDETEAAPAETDAAAEPVTVTTSPATGNNSVASVVAVMAVAGVAAVAAKKRK